MIANSHKIDELCKLYSKQQLVAASGMVISRMIGSTNPIVRAMVLSLYLQELESCLDEAGDKINTILIETNETLGIKP